MLTPLSPNVLGYDAVPVPTAVELYKLLDAAGAEVTFTPFAMVKGTEYVEDGVTHAPFWGTLDGSCIPLLSEGATWSLIWETTLAGYDDPIYDRQTLLVGFEIMGAGLCTRAQVKERGNIPSAITASDAQIDSLIPAVLATFNARYGREFMPQVTATRTFDIRHTLIPLRAFDLRTATTVLLHPEATSPTTLAASVGYILDHYDDLTGTYAAIRIPDSLGFSSGRMTGFGRAQVSVTGNWGCWADATHVPDDVNSAAIDTVLAWMNKPASEMASLVESFDGRGPSPASTWDIPAAAHRKMQPYNRNFGAW